MQLECIDTIVIVRFLIETPESIPQKFRGVFRFFNKLELGTVRVHLPGIVAFQCYFVLTSFYNVPGREAAQKLAAIVGFRGVHATHKEVLPATLRRLTTDTIDLVDAYLLEYSRANHISGVFSFDRDLKDRGLKLLAME